MIIHFFNGNEIEIPNADYFDFNGLFLQVFSEDDDLLGMFNITQILWVEGLADDESN